MSRLSMLPASQWLLALALCLTEKLTMPVVEARCCDPDYAIQDSDLTRAHTSFFPPERVILQRLLNNARHAICLHAGVTLIVVGTKYLKPLETEAL